MQLHETKSTTTPMDTGHNLSKTEGTPLDNATQYRIIIGALQYSNLIRLEINFSVNKLYQFL